MLPRSSRLSREDFEKLPGLNRAASPHLSLSYGYSQETSGCAVVVSKKVAKLSVSRHLIKRRIRNIARPWCTQGRIIIIHARSGIIPVPFRELKAELEALLAAAFPGK